MIDRRLLEPGLCIALLATAGCAKMAPQAMMAPSPEAEAQYSESLTLRQIEELKPQLRFPIHLAVSQPTSGLGWSREEIELIESWLPALVPERAAACPGTLGKRRLDPGT